MRKIVLLSAVFALLAMSANAAIFGDGFGINVKNERITPAELDEIAAIGIKRVRVSISWYAVEQQAGQYRWDVQIPRRFDADDYATRKTFSYDDLFAMIVKRGLKADTTLHEGNAGLLGLVNIAAAGQQPSYRHIAPHSEDQIAMFANFSAATVKHYEGLYGRNAIRWHIWNEPDTDGGFPPKTDPAIVGKLLADSCQAIRKISPSAVVMGPALGAYGDGDLRYDFIDGLFERANALTCINGLTVHPYRSSPPENAIGDYAKVAAHIAPYQNKMRPAVPVAVDEWGYAINEHPNGVPSTQKWRDWSQEEQAALMLRMYLTNLQANVPLTVIYEWRDSCTNPDDWECHFGVKAYDNKDKAAVQMFRYVWPTLLGRAFIWKQPIAACSAKENLMRFGSRAKDSTYWTLLWTSGAARPISIEGSVLQITDIFGNPIKPNQISGSPIMIQHLPLNKISIRCG